MRNIDFDDICTYTSPVFWISVILMLVFKVIGKLYLWSTIDDWIFIWFKIDKAMDSLLYNIIELRKSRPFRIKMFWWHKSLVWNVAARKAIQILRERNKATRIK